MKCIFFLLLLLFFLASVQGATLRNLQADPEGGELILAVNACSEYDAGFCIDCAPPPPDGSPLYVAVFVGFYVNGNPITSFLGEHEIPSGGSTVAPFPGNADGLMVVTTTEPCAPNCEDYIGYYFSMPCVPVCEPTSLDCFSEPDVTYGVIQQVVTIPIPECHTLDDPCQCWCKNPICSSPNESKIAVTSPLCQKGNVRRNVSPGGSAP